MVEPLLEVEDLTVSYGGRSGFLGSGGAIKIKAVNDISFFVNQGETLGIVGESGCGKSTAGRASILLQPRSSGSIRFEGEDLSHLPKSELAARRRRMQMVFQDPLSSLTPHYTVERLLAEPIKAHRLRSGQGVRRRVQELLEMVSLNPDHASRYPHQFSGGQRQRIGIARALAVEPSLIVCDEAVSALDVSVQAQVVNLLEDLQKELGLTYIFISHGLSVVRHVSSRIAVMYLGKIVEIGPAEEISDRALHPYTKALLSSVPIPDPRIEKQRTRVMLSGDLPSPINPPSGCPFRTRCPIAIEICARVEPPLEHKAAAADGQHLCACHRADENLQPTGRS